MVPDPSNYQLLLHFPHCAPCPESLSSLSMFFFLYTFLSMPPTSLLHTSLHKTDKIKQSRKRKLRRQPYSKRADGSQGKSHSVSLHFKFNRLKCVKLRATFHTLTYSIYWKKLDKTDKTLFSSVHFHKCIFLQMKSLKIVLLERAECWFLFHAKLNYFFLLLQLLLLFCLL